MGYLLFFGIMCLILFLLSRRDLGGAPSKSDATRFLPGSAVDSETHDDIGGMRVDLTPDDPRNDLSAFTYNSHD